MSRKIIGVTVGSPLPKPNLMQNDPNRGDYVKGKEEFLKQADVDLTGYATEEFVRNQITEAELGGGDNVLMVIFENGVSSHSPSEIVYAVREGKYVFALNKDADKDDPIYFYVEANLGSALFARIEFNEGGLSYRTIWKTIKFLSDKKLEFDYGQNAAVPLPFSSDVGRVLTKTENGLQWEELPGNNMFENLPVFDLNEMGMSAITLDGTLYECECDTTELMAAMEKSIVRIRGDINDGTEVIKGEGLFMQTMHVTDGVHQAVVRATMKFSGDFYDFRLIVEPGIIYLSATPDNRSADVSAEIEEALEQAKASGEFDGKDGQDGYTPQKNVDYFDGKDGKDGQNGKDGADGKTPVKGVDYYTEADKTEMVNAVIDALPEDSAGIPTIDLMELGFQPQKQSNDVHFVTIDETIYNEILQKMEKGFVNVVFPIADGNDAYTYTVGLSCAGAKTDGTTGLVYGNSVYVNSNNANQFELYLTADRIGFRYNAYIPVMYSYQDMSEESKAQARNNIGAASVEDVLAALPTWTGGSY